MSAPMDLIHPIAREKIRVNRRDLTKSTAATAVGLLTGLTGRVSPAEAAVLPYSPRTSWDVTVDFNVTDIRTCQSAAYSGKHIRVIPKKPSTPTMACSSMLAPRSLLLAVTSDRRTTAMRDLAMATKVTASSTSQVAAKSILKVSFSIT
jgi:hypothetical protein